MSAAVSKAKLKLLERFFPNASEATVETVEILMDMEQMSTLLTSFEEVRTGKIIAAQDAFSDLWKSDIRFF